MKRLSTAALALPLALMFLLAACSGDGGESTTTEAESTPTTGATGEEAAITIDDFAFSGTATVSVGDTVTITNEDSVAHTWTAVDDEFDSGNLGTGDRFDITFDEPGEFDYFCSIHPTMTGTITVEG